ncbi:MAG: hypothetical protein LH478_09340 [Chitinophagaceae bacterium]|nr:hypothetical protein [Chitinophagaceae bacterium]
MQVQMEIEFDDLLKIVKNLPRKQLTRFKKELEDHPKADPKREDFKAFLLNGTTFSKKQLETIAKTRNAINQWRTK